MSTTILHLSLTDIRSDSRILKELTSIDKKFSRADLVAVGIELFTKEAPIDNAVNTIYTMKPIFFLKNIPILGRYVYLVISYIQWLLFASFIVLKSKPKVIHCHDMPPLPVGLFGKILFRSKLIYDAHELESERNAISRSIKAYTLLVERIIIPHIDLLITVSDSISSWYTQKYSLQHKRKIVVRNIPVQNDDNIHDFSYSDFTYLSKYYLNFIYVGFLVNGRGIEATLKAFESSKLSNRSVTFIGFGPLKEYIEGFSSNHSNIYYHKPVKHAEVVAFLKRFDVGLCFLEPVSLSDYYCLPNKLFEYHAACLPVLASKFPDIEQFVLKNHSGWVCESEPFKLAEALNALTENDVCKVRESLSVKENIINWSSEIVELLDIYNQFIVD